MTLATPSRSFTDSDIKRLFSAGTLRKAQAYLRAIGRIEVNADHIHATVSGSAPEPYEVDIHFLDNPPIFAQVGQRWLIEPGCSCPVGYACKHAAAVMLLVLREREKAADKVPQINPQVAQWAEEMRADSGTRGAGHVAGKPRSAQAIYYILVTDNWRKEQVQLHLLKGRIDDKHRPSSSTSTWSNLERALVSPPQFVCEADLDIFRVILRLPARINYLGEITLSGRLGAELLALVMGTGRAYFGAASARSQLPFQPLCMADQRPATLQWRHEEGDLLRPYLETSPAATQIVPTEPPWFLDLTAGQAGPVDCDAPSRLLSRLLTLPALTPVDVAVVAEVLQEAAPRLPLPNERAERNLRTVDVSPIPVLKLDSARLWGLTPHRGYAGEYGQVIYDYAEVAFRYDDITVGRERSPEYLTLANGDPVRLKRRREEETRHVERLKAAGFAPPPRHALHYHGDAVPAEVLGLESEAAWSVFFRDLAPELEDDGWEIDFPADFRHHLLEPGEWDLDVNEMDDVDNPEGGSHWFKVSLGIEVDGQRIELAPLLHALFRRDARWLDAAQLAAIADDERVVLIDPENRRLAVPAGRLKPLARTLIDLFDGLPGDGTLRVSKFDADRITSILESGEWRSEGLDAVERFAAMLPNTRVPRDIPAPAGLALELRPYQREGLNWLQHLREHGLAGILADDMGLGKTAQTLAHLLVEKESGRLDKPALIVLPTSLVFNWQREAERFAPSLRVLALHGKERQTMFEQIPDSDVCLTTYPLLWRDEEVLQEQDWHLLILDEAQTVKNAASKAAVVVRKLQARHRLCLTGTPLENHLGELWAQFDFLLPGFLGDHKRFNSTWRSPIEKHGNVIRRELLAKRIRPFLLRRRKDDVAKELPPKTIIVRAVELESGQRDLYETVRSAMDKQVRDAIAAQGFARSQIVILDALLKLRQVCCDPRLMKLPAAARVKERAKLDLLMDMLPEMIEEGRRVLVFSQFTGMLDLIQTELDRYKLPFVRLDGQTGDRRTPVRRFQEGEVPIFLISLKAGGVGLNLTAADTVIHYDPWWNPAAENQATDRAHRIGQDKPVFVYKLVVAGSIEEKILALQERKAELAASVLSEDYEGTSKFGEADIAALLAPLPTEKKMAPAR